MQRRDFIKYMIVSATSVAAGVFGARFIRQQRSEVIVLPSDNFDSLCSLAEAIAIPKPSIRKIEEFRVYLEGLCSTRQFLGISYLKFYSQLIAISSKIKIKQWNDPVNADLLLNIYFAETQNSQARVIYGGKSVKFAELALKDMLLFFAIGKGEFIELDLDKINQLYIDDSSATTSDTSLNGNGLFEMNCSGCHIKRALSGKTKKDIQNALLNNPSMSAEKKLQNLTQEQIYAIAKFLAD